MQLNDSILSCKMYKWVVGTLVLISYNTWHTDMLCRCYFNIVVHLLVCQVTNTKSEILAVWKKSCKTWLRKHYL